MSQSPTLLPGIPWLPQRAATLTPCARNPPHPTAQLERFCFDFAIETNPRDWSLDEVGR